jgi:hypothetical protein
VESRYKPVIPTQIISHYPNSKHLIDRDKDIFWPKLIVKNSYEIFQATYEWFKYACDLLPAWEYGLVQEILPSTYHFPKFVLMCSSLYDPSQRVVMSCDGSRMVFPVT